MTIEKSPERGPAARNPLLVHLREYLIQGPIWMLSNQSTSVRKRLTEEAVKRLKPLATNGADSRRSRILDDDEIRVLWKVAGELGAYGALLKGLLLTAQRRGVRRAQV